MYTLIITKTSINKVFLYGLSFRLLICFYFLIYPIVHQKYGILNSFSYQYFTDLNFYFKFLNIINFESSYFKEFSYIYGNLIKFNYEAFFNSDFNILNYRFPGPFFPTILYITSYSADFTIVLAILIFLIELVTLRLWITYFYNRINIIYIIIFAMLPMPMILGFLHTSDVFFYLLSTIIFFIAIGYFKINNILFSILLLIFICIRPASIGILAGLFTFYIFYQSKGNLFKIFFIGLCIFLSLFYYQTYFLVEKSIVFKNDLVIDFIRSNITNQKIIELILYYPLKLFFLFGFHPSSSGSQIIYISRCFFGLILLFGYFYSFKYYNKFSFYFLNFTIIPIIFFLYPAWRYLIPLSPILYLNLTRLIDTLIFYFRKKRI